MVLPIGAYPWLYCRKWVLCIKGVNVEDLQCRTLECDLHYLILKQLHRPISTVFCYSDVFRCFYGTTVVYCWVLSHTSLLRQRIRVLYYQLGPWNVSHQGWLPSYRRFRQIPRIRPIISKLYTIIKLIKGLAKQLINEMLIKMLRVVENLHTLRVYQWQSATGR